MRLRILISTWPRPGCSQISGGVKWKTCVCFSNKMKISNFNVGFFLFVCLNTELQSEAERKEEIFCLLVLSPDGCSSQVWDRP